MRCPFIFILELFCLSTLAQGTIPIRIDTSGVNALLTLSEQSAYDEPAKSMDYATRSLAISKEINFSSGEIRSFYQLGSLSMMKGDRVVPLNYFDSGLILSRKINDQFLIALGLYHQSRYSEISHDFSHALDYLTQSLSIFEKLGLKKNKANCFSSFGRIYQELGNYAQALDYDFKALRMKEELNDKRSISVSLTNIGNVYLVTSKLDDAIDYFTKALSIDSSNHDQEGIFINLLNIGAANQKKGAYEIALEKYKAALEIARSLKYKEDEALLLENIGSTMKDEGKLKDGLTYMMSALDIQIMNGYKSDHTLNDIAETYLALEDPKSAKKYSLMAIESSKKTADLNQLHFAWLNLSKAYQKSGEFAGAYDALTQSNIAKDSLFSLEKSKQMNELQLQYETEKKQQTINLLTQQKDAANFRRNTYLVAGVLIIVILLLLYNGQRNKSLKNQALFEKGQEVDRMKSTFFANLSHEFRTPLTLILGPTQLLRATTMDPKINDQLITIETNANRLLQLINQLLDLSRIDSGKLALVFSKRDIVPLVKGVTMTFHSLAEMKQIQLFTTAEPDHLELYFDAEKIETIIINLLSNAFKFTPTKGLIHVSIKIENKKQKDWCKICVKDTGIGIPAKDIGNVFDRFYQSDNAAEGNYGGSGIGLALTKQLVELHKGSIEIFSDEGKGTEIVVILPLGSDHLSQTELQNTREENETNYANRLIETSLGADPDLESRLEIENASAPILLLIEDNDDVMKYLKTILSQDYQIMEACDGAVGIEKAVEIIPDLIISDIMMPKKNGYEVCETLKMDERTSHVPIILLTARASFEDKIQGLSTRADEYLTKPFVPKELLVRIQNLIQLRKQLREKYNRELILKPSDILVSSIDESFLQKVMTVVEENIADEQFSMEKLGREVGMSRSQIHRKLHALTNQSATEFIRSFRLNRARDMILKNAGSISEIAYWVGFSSPSYFSKCFHEQFGVTPGEARNKSI